MGLCSCKDNVLRDAPGAVLAREPVAHREVGRPNERGKDEGEGSERERGRRRRRLAR